MRNARTRWGSLALVALAAVVMTACGSSPQSAIDPQGPFAKKPDDLFQIVFWIAVVVFILVQGLIIVAAMKFRAKPGDDEMPVQTHGNTRLEILWTVIPAMILAGIAIPTVQAVFDLDAVPEGAVEIEVIGHRWWWEYRYVGAGADGADIVTANEMIIPAGVPVRLSMTAEEKGGAANAVIHSFWVPPLAGKKDVVPGRITTLNLQADEPGRYLGQCAEYCGLSHANMRIRVVAKTAAEYDQWLADQAQPAVEPAEGTLEAQGRDVFFGSTCVTCHAIGGASVADPANAGQQLQALGTVGPNLTHLASRTEFAGAIFDLNAENLAKWLDDPPAMKPMRPYLDQEKAVGMPKLGLTADQITALVAYLLSLR